MFVVMKCKSWLPVSVGRGKEQWEWLWKSVVGAMSIWPKSRVASSPPFSGAIKWVLCSSPPLHAHWKWPGFFLFPGRVSQDVGISMLRPRRSGKSGHLAAIPHLCWPNVSPSSSQYTRSPTCCECWITLSCLLLWRIAGLTLVSLLEDPHFHSQGET